LGAGNEKLNAGSPFKELIIISFHPRLGHFVQNQSKIILQSERFEMTTNAIDQLLQETLWVLRNL